MVPTGLLCRPFSNSMKRKSMNSMEGTDVPRWESVWCVWNVQEIIVAGKEEAYKGRVFRRKDQRNSRKPGPHGSSPSAHGLWCPSLKCVQWDEFKLIRVEAERAQSMFWKPFL